MSGKPLIERLLATPNRATHQVALGNGQYVTTPGLGHSSEDDSLRKESAKVIDGLEQQLAEQAAYSQHLKSKIPYGITFNANPSPALLAAHDKQVIEDFVKFYRAKDGIASSRVLSASKEYSLINKHKDNS